MGKRKSRTSKLLAQPKKAPKLDKEFTCPFCNLLRVDCRIFSKGRPPYAVAMCSACMAAYYTKANALTEPIDVYSEWIDECEEANEGLVVRRPRLLEPKEEELKTEDSS